MRSKIAAAALVAALSFSLAGCSSGDKNAGSGEGESLGVITTNSTEPQTGLIPPMINEVGGGKIADMMWAGLIYYDEDGKAVNEVAESIETEDSQTYTVKLKEGWKFSDGTPVTAKSFVDSWNWGAKLSNKALSREFFSPIQGFSEDTDSDLTGLKVVSDTEFTITLESPQSDFPARLGYSAFYPMPESAFADMDAYGKNPIGNGPYVLSSWEHQVKLEMRPNPDYDGGRKAQNGGVDFVIYEQESAAYNDLMSNNLDVIETIPPEALSTFTSDLGDRAVNEPGAVFQSFSIPNYLDHFGFDEEGVLRRQAISMAIDRGQITDKIFNNTRAPATDFISPVIPGHQESLKGAEVLQYNPEKAKELWAKANEISDWGDATFELAYNSDGPHKEWVEAVCNSVKQTLDIEALPKPYATFKELRGEASDGTLTSALRTGWQADYPSAYNFLGPLYRAVAGSNDARYNSEEFEALLDAGLAAPDRDQAEKHFTEAQEVLLRDLPAIPLWYQNTLGGYSENVDNVKFGWNTVPLYHLVTKN